MRVGTELDNLLEVAQFAKHEADDGRHPDAVRGWDKYKTYFTFDGKIIFEGEISIKLLKKGDLFYDITKIKDTSIARAAETADGSSSASNRDVSINNIHQNAENVNSESQKGKKFALPDTDSDGNALSNEQRAFFSRSKITDAEGRLLSLYHGSNAYEEIHVFRRGKNGYLGGGIYLTDSESYARKYADKNGYKGRIYNVYANASSPLEVSTNTPAKEILTIAKSA